MTPPHDPHPDHAQAFADTPEAPDDLIERLRGELEQLQAERLLERAATTADRNLHMNEAGSAEVTRVAAVFNRLMAKGQQADRHD